jgi:hypothetical protein
MPALGGISTLLAGVGDERTDTILTHIHAGARGEGKGLLSQGPALKLG